MRKAGQNATTDIEGAEPHPQARDRMPQPIEWMRSLESGSSQLDAEHRALISQCNDLTSLAACADRDTFETSVAALAASLAQHFENEESLLRATGFPRLDSHIREHCGIVIQMQEIKTRAAVAGTRSARAEVVRETRELMLEILLRHDLDYKSHILFSRGNRVSKEEAGS